ncbi:MAG: DUF4835 family protein, partial [Chitinophagaceae bacterium]|nr:DUF4835 family protein [Chitinophagaceae bacterium]
QARISINSSAISSQVDKKIFQTLQTAIQNLLNNRKWTNDTYQQQEKISCNFLLIITEANNNVFKGSLTVQAARPVFNASYNTPLINFRDEAVAFRYAEFQPIEFNENRVSGSEGLSSNLSAIFAYYVYLILGLDYDSFSLRGGDPYFQKAQYIVNNAPDGRDIIGWKAFDGQRNRYWLAENLVNNRYALVHDAIYNYYRLGMDFMYENESEARAATLNAISQLTTLNNDMPNSMVIPFFFQGKAMEVVRIFKKAPPEERQKAREMLSRLDISNANTYKQELK